MLNSLRKWKWPLSAAVVAGVCAIATYYVNLAVPEGERAANGLDYWLNRYQTLVTGVLAILGAGFAVYSARLSIEYDREKVINEKETARRDGRRAVRRIIEYAWKVTHSKRHLINSSKDFPYDIYPTVLLEYQPIEQVVLTNLKDIPAPMVGRCFYIAYSMKFVSSRFERAIQVQLLADVVDQSRANPWERCSDA